MGKGEYIEKGDASRGRGSKLDTSGKKSSDTDKNTTGDATIYARRSFIGRATYDFKGKYLAEILFRRDGSLKFPTSNRWGNFPGFLVGWRISEEDFWKDNLSFINYFKLFIY